MAAEYVADTMNAAIGNASWAKLMAAGLTLNSEDLKPYGSPRAKDAGYQTNYYPIEMVQALVGVWLFPSAGSAERKRPIVRKTSARFLAVLSHVGRRSTRLAGVPATRSPRSRSFAAT
ncbi:hypothetical protein HII36_08295 [Nonomuraea sp. NN258]|uniref:hypothetical protein n=1 Tax=Nonomuraea antri TaxID=2730852 RepID=UPI001568890D|nr:hypothetical protein [Nonomuraea antri]NRQ31838.1 hypothetical protein [Nonomuraea antri]